MKPKLLFTIVGILYVVVGIVSMFVPASSWHGNGEAPLDFIQLARAFAAYMTALGVILLLARNAEPSTARDAIVVGAIVANVLDGLGNVVGLILGYWVAASTAVLILNIILAVAFFLVERTGTSSKTVSA
jgi:hypothetical protein